MSEVRAWESVRFMVEETCYPHDANLPPTVSWKSFAHETAAAEYMADPTAPRPGRGQEFSLVTVQMFAVSLTALHPPVERPPLTIYDVALPWEEAVPSIKVTSTPIDEVPYMYRAASGILYVVLRPALDQEPPARISDQGVLCGQVTFSRRVFLWLSSPEENEIFLRESLLREAAEVIAHFGLTWTSQQSSSS